MKKKLIIFSILSIATLLTFTYTNKTLINNEIKTLTNIATEEITNINPNKKSITIGDIPSITNYTDDYNIKILSIVGLDRVSEVRNNEKYISLICKVTFSYNLENKKYIDSTETQVLFINKDDIWNILSIDDFTKAILKCIADNSNINDSKVAQINHLIYESDSLNISFNYSSALKYSSTKGESTDEGVYETITLTDSDTENKYIKIYLQEKPVNLSEKIIELTNKDYKIIEESEIIADIEFTKLENSFSQDGTIKKETIYLCKDTFDTAQFISITTNENESFQKDIQIIINSLKK